MGFVRIAGLIERGREHSKCLVAPLPIILLSPGARPPTESSLDVAECDLIRKIRKRGTILFADGAKSWRKAAESSGLHFESVNHSLLQFAKSVTLPDGVRAVGPQKKSKQITAGTQTLDRAWQDLKKYVPSELHAKDHKANTVNGDLWEYIYSWQWRRNCGMDLWQSVPDLFHA